MKLNRKNLKSLILEVLEESEYYDKHKGMDTDYVTQAMELGQSMSDEGSRNREEQVEKYVRLKVNKEIGKEIIRQVEWAIRELTDEARGVMGFAKGDDADEWDKKETENLRKMYTRHMKRAMDAAMAFDGTQESVDQWAFIMMRTERKLYDNNDPAMYYLGSIIPEYLHIGKPFFQSYDDPDDPDWGGHYRKSVEIETAVKEAEDFYRPGITKMVLKAQSAETGMDLGGMFGLNENKEDEFELPESIKDLIYEEGHLTQAIELLAMANGIEILCERESENYQRKEYYFYVSSTAEASLLHHYLAPFFRLKRSEKAIFTRDFNRDRTEPGPDMWVGVGWPTEWPEGWKECDEKLGPEWRQNGAILNISVDKY